VIGALVPVVHDLIERGFLVPAEVAPAVLALDDGGAER